MIFLKTQPNIEEFFRANWRRLLLCHSKTLMDTTMFLRSKEGSNRQNSVASVREESDYMSNPSNPPNSSITTNSLATSDPPIRLTVPAPKRYNLLSDDELQEEIRRSYNTDDRISIGSINENPLYL